MKKFKSVAKFGGSSVAKYPQKIKKIFENLDRERNFLVVSAPGKINNSDIKLTDILIEISQKEKISSQDYKKIIDKFKKIGISFSSEKIKKILIKSFAQKKKLNSNQYQALIISLGEKFQQWFMLIFWGQSFWMQKTFLS